MRHSLARPAFPHSPLRSHERPTSPKAIAPAFLADLRVSVRAIQEVVSMMRSGVEGHATIRRSTGCDKSCEWHPEGAEGEAAEYAPITAYVGDTRQSAGIKPGLRIIQAISAKGPAGVPPRSRADSPSFSASSDCPAHSPLREAA
jgi:hypothetical protein